MSSASAEPAVFLCPELAGTLMSPEEFDAVEEYDENYRYELIHGVLVVTPIALAEETDPNEELGRMLRNYQEQHLQGHTLDKTLPQQYVRTSRSRRLADRLIWAGLGRVPDRRRDLPAVVVEFVSASRRDRQRDYVDKRQEYTEIRIPEYWIIDRFRRIMTVIHNRPGGVEEQVIRENETYSTPLLPGFELPLARLFGVADSWEQPQP
ncbi:MAG TPA: Uma2 family endonuclease [Gemmataceae bacterium]|jgi:Uma2 family endonuclease|nr:Uma2 family endonuclease [Gemmataceae bacterium]